VATKRVDALVIFGATGDLAKIETFPALVGLVKVAWHDPAGQPG
jgi:glucose-6-phosphate 1-dehydrogenase